LGRRTSAAQTIGETPTADPLVMSGLPILAARAAVLAWYRRLGRPLVFRRTKDPYRVLVLEVMAQQTQVARAAEHWGAFVERFPSFEALAEATPADVVGAWRGLGYNRRALNLRRSARVVVADHGGRLPDEIATLERLPGVGPYTARAVAATAFGVAVGAVDTNVRRVLGRLLGGQAVPGPRLLQSTADALVAPADPAGWTHAVMDLGATICTPRTPRCQECPLMNWCRFAAERGSSTSSSVARPAEARRPATAPRRSSVAFNSTTRWLRGRIIDVLRDADEGAWVAFEDPIGEHSPQVIAAALSTLAGEDLVELRRAACLEARLPLS
jgi:A/G-specific adenine glycosylase